MQLDPHDRPPHLLAPLSLIVDLVRRNEALLPMKAVGFLLQSATVRV